MFSVQEQWRPVGSIENNVKKLSKIAEDHTIGFMWQKGLGFKGNPTREDVQEYYITPLNHKRFAGYDDWRLPTAEELMSMLEPEIQSQGVYLNPIFGATWTWSWCWNADQAVSEAKWGVAFDLGGVGSGYHNCVCAVRP